MNELSDEDSDAIVEDLRQQYLIFVQEMNERLKIIREQSKDEWTSNAGV